MATHDVDGLNSGYARLLLDEYLENPEAVSAEWQELFERDGNEIVSTLPGLARLLDGHPNGAPATNGHAVATVAPAEPAPTRRKLAEVAAAMGLVKAYRLYGHLAAWLDPLGTEPVGDPSLDPLRHDPPLTPEVLVELPTELLEVGVEGETLAEAIPRLNATYCGTLAYQIEHIADHEQRVWLRDAIERGTYRAPLSVDEKLKLYDRLCDVEGMERYLRRAFLGQKQFSLEGLDVLIPMLDEAIELAAEAGARDAVIGMAHRGRLNVLAHTVGMAYEEILREFEGERMIEAVISDSEGGTGDVKYHLGAHGTRETASGEVEVTIAANPSHLEAVDPVVEGWTRAEQTDRTGPVAGYDASLALPILLHGDAAFAGQGVVAETLNLEGLGGYSTGGTLHIITDNQIGFTAEPTEGRSTRYSSDLAKGFDIPIVHVNADDPEAAVWAVRLALAYRARFGHDLVIDLIGYRRFGHNEQDEPAYTQPLQVARIEAHPTVRELYAQRLRGEGLLTGEEAEAREAAVEQQLREAHDRLKASLEAAGQTTPRENGVHHDDPVASAKADIDPPVRGKQLRELQSELLTVPEGFTVHPKLASQLERRRTALEEGTIDWGQAESLALASLLCAGVPVRFTGQDTERGTFSQRHLVLHDVHTGERYTPMQHLREATVPFELHNSPLSEFACLGFEYGYSIAAPNDLVIWEGQFGDFANGAQTITDQFISSGYAKWRQTSRLTLLLPHGYEGNGPEHSSARLERFLQLAAQENLRIANCTTAAQYYHLLRQQGLDPDVCPLVVMTPKGLLRFKGAASKLKQLSKGSFQPVLDATVADRATVRRLVICSGKVYYDIVGHEEAGVDPEGIAVARLEQLYPFPVAEFRELIARYPALDEVVWAQEEPQNMGAWRAIRHRLEEAAAGTPVRYVGRPWRASTAEGYPTAHLREQDRIARAALDRS